MVNKAVSFAYAANDIYNFIHFPSSFSTKTIKIFDLVRS